MAVTLTIVFGGRIDGAVYKPELEIVPKAAFPPAIPFTVQLTVVWEVPVTTA